MTPDIGILKIAFRDKPFSDTQAALYGFSLKDLEKLVEDQILWSALKDQTSCKAVEQTANTHVFRFREGV
jgi:hypothetical protein